MSGRDLNESEGQKLTSICSRKIIFLKAIYKFFYIMLAFISRLLKLDYI